METGTCKKDLIRTHSPIIKVPILLGWICCCCNVIISDMGKVFHQLVLLTQGLSISLQHIQWNTSSTQFFVFAFLEFGAFFGAFFFTVLGCGFPPVLLPLFFSAHPVSKLFTCHPSLWIYCEFLPQHAHFDQFGWPLASCQLPHLNRRQNHPVSLQP